MALPARIGLLFLALAAIFLTATLRDYLRAEGQPSSRRRTWLRVAIIFIIVGVSLQFLPRCSAGEQTVGHAPELFDLKSTVGGSQSSSPRPAAWARQRRIDVL